MWILESNADFLQGKRMWLKPGKKYLFGRVKRDGVRFAIDHKTISRKHFVITVDNVRPGDVTRIHARSKITITDENSKGGTHIDGELLKDDTRTLTKTEHSIRPGTFNHELIIKWQPCVLTFSITKKEIKADALRSKRERLEELDVKVITEYVTASTTHVVAGKRNTAKGLQALIQGKSIVADSYVDALVYAATPADLVDEENLSPLEEDFDTAWPKECNHLPPVGKEPTARPVESYAPNPARSSIFENFTIIFGDQTQYDSLMPPITLGQGKALMYKVVYGETTADELIEYMRNAAGLKGFGDAQKDTDTGGVILVRWHGTDQYRDWTEATINEVVLKLDQRAIDQAEFLDAILANDAFTLRQTIPYASTIEGRAAPPPTAASFQSIRQTPESPPRQKGPSKQDPSVRRGPLSSFQAASSQAVPSAPLVPPSFFATQAETRPIPSSRPEPAIKTQVNDSAATNGDTEAAPPPQKRSRLRGAPVPKFTQFDDDFDPDAVSSYTAEDYTESQAPSQSQGQSESQSLPYSRDISAAPSIDVKGEPQSNRKRRRQPSPSAVPGSEDDDIDDLFPAITAMKRRKIALEAEAKASGKPIASNELMAAPPPTKQRAKKKEKEIDVRKTVKAQREADEEAARKEREDLEEGLGYANDEKKPANLAVVVMMDLPLRGTQNVHGEQHEQSDRWNPQWNGRKNFKRFRKSRIGEDARVERSRVHQVIVPLVEVKRNTYGFGEKYWDRTGDEEVGDGSRRKKKGKEAKHSQVQTQSQSQDRSQARSSETQTRTQTQTIFGSNTGVASTHSQTGAGTNGDEEPSSTSPAVTRLQREAVDIVNHAVNTDTPRQTRLADKTQSQNIPSQAAGRKRPAPKAKAGGATKKQRTIPTVAVHGSDSEDSDDLKFKFGRHQKGKGKT